VKDIITEVGIGRICLAFSFDVSRAFLQGDTITPIPYIFLVLLVLCDRDSTASFCFDFYRVLFLGATMSLHPWIFYFVSLRSAGKK